MKESKSSIDSVKNMINSNKLFIIVAILIVIILIVLVCYSMNKKEMFSENKELLYFSLSTCPHCDDFNPIWEKIQNKTERCYKHVVDKDDVSREKADKMNISRFPTVVIVSNDNIDEEVNDLSCNGIREMCMKHNIPCTVSC